MTLENVVDIIVEKFRPYSIFLYGSKATMSDNNWSDCEIGVIFEDGKYVSRKEIVDSINDTNYSIFPFKLSEISNHIIDTPFQKEIYLKSLIDGGAKTLYGVTVLENLEAPEVTREHLLADVNFNLGISKTETAYQMRIAQIVKNIVETTAYEVSDCFYTFDNTKYDAMLNDAELKRSQNYPLNNNGLTSDTIDGNEFYSILNEFDSKATLQENTDTFKRAFNQITANITEEVLPEDVEHNQQVFKAKQNIKEEI